MFAACVDPEQLAAWWGPAGFTAPRVDLDAREGGLYRITMQPPEGDAFHLRGQFTRIDAPQCLVYTFEWEEPDPDDRETLVTLSFLDDRDGTRLVLDQGMFRDPGSIRPARGGLDGDARPTRRAPAAGG